jgi:hypothetical protein
MFKVAQVGRGETQVLDGIVEVAMVRQLPNGWFEIRVHGIGWTEDGEPLRSGGKACLLLKRRDEALIIAAQTAERFSGS